MKRIKCCSLIFPLQTVVKYGILKGNGSDLDCFTAPRAVALFVLHGFYGAVKERIRTARAPRFASRGAETPRWGVSRARLGKSLRAHKKKRIAMYFCNAFFPDFRIILVAYHLPHQCIVLLPAVHFSVDLQWYA